VVVVVVVVVVVGVVVAVVVAVVVVVVVLVVLVLAVIVVVAVATPCRGRVATVAGLDLSRAGRDSCWPGPAASRDSDTSHCGVGLAVVW